MSKNNDALYAGIAMLVVILTVFSLAPFAVIWALNELFHLGIAYTFFNWLAMFVLLILINVSVTKSSK
jgi:hypothetical protein